MEFLLLKTPCQEVLFNYIEYSRFYAEKCDFAFFDLLILGQSKKTFLYIGYSLYIGNIAELQPKFWEKCMQFFVLALNYPKFLINHYQGLIQKS